MQDQPPSPPAPVKQEPDKDQEPAPAVPPSSSSSSSSASAPQSSTRPRRSLATKPQTPKAHSREPNGRPAPASSSSSSAHKRIKPCFTSSTDFAAPAAPESSLGPDDSQPQRNQRRSKVEAISKLDRAGTPVQVASGPTATSFIPAANAPTQPPPPSGPSVQRNPLHWPPKVNPRFSIDSVKTSAPRHPPNKSGKRLFGLQDCPTYYPTADQFQDCMGYIDSIADEAKEYGICKIVPPAGWQMPFTLETEKFRFRTRLQQLNSLEAASRAKINFLEQLQLYHEQGDGRLVIPTIDRRPLDLYQLRKAVNKIGGHEEVNRMRGWPVIAKTLGYDERYALTIRSSYLRIILPFDIFANAGKSQSNSPLSPLANVGTAETKPPGFTSDSPGSPTRPSRMGTTLQAPRPVRVGDSLSASNVALALRPTALEPPVDIPSRPTSATPSGTAALRIKVSGFASRDGSESELSDEESPRKTKAKKNQTGEVCEVCQRGDDAPKILLCDGCDKGFHTYCLNPPLTFVPTNEEWYCGPCLFAQGDGYGFDEGEDHSIASFQARDQAFAEAWWTKHATFSQPDVLSRSLGKSVVTEDDVEREFWRLTEDQNDTVEIEYGADIHSSTHGSGSPTMETHPLNKYSRDGWNVNNMPILPDSILRYIRSDISGMTVPWIYVGMIFSAFCWHNEDHYTYSVNYMHWGETKTWYGIPGSDAEKFEAAMMSEAPELFEQQPSLLFQLVTMMNPGRITEAGVKVVACDQRPNEFVITFPKAYHCGFNHGINFNEAVNFALPDWLSQGKAAVLKYKTHAKAPVFSHNELLINITLYSETIKTAIWLKDALAEMVREETTRRAKLRAEVPMLAETLEEEDIPEEQYQCTICKGYCYLSQVTCSCTKLVACVDHSDFLCSCDKTQRQLRKRFSEAQLEDILSIVEARAALPAAWREKLDDVILVPRPPLKSLRALLAEGEKIAFNIPEVHDLRALVTRANAWVEKAILLATRKSTGRRKRGRQTEEEEPERTHDALKALLEEAERLAFDAPEIAQLRQTLHSIDSFKEEAAAIMALPEDHRTLRRCETALILGQSLNIDLEEIQVLQTNVNRLLWFHKIHTEVDDLLLSYEDILGLLAEAMEYGISGHHPTIVELRRREQVGRNWKMQAEDVLSRDVIEIRDIEALLENPEDMPTPTELIRQVESISRTVDGWQATADAQFAGQGSSNAAQRLCKAVKLSTGPLGRVRIPEITALQDELDFHALWIGKIARVLDILPKRVTATLNSILQAFERQLDPADNYPSEAFGCFCRNPPAATMVTCFLCNGTYHPKCVDVAPRNIDKPFRCEMCTHTTFDDRPSLNELSHLAVPKRYNFRIMPAEMVTLQRIVDIGVAFARIIVLIVDPLGQATVCRNFDLLAHWLRKLYTLPVTFDAQHVSTKQRVVFEEFLQKRMVEAKGPTKPRTRPRKPKLALKQAKEGVFSCICTTPPQDSLATVTCYKCAQGYHASCVHAPVECLGPEGTRWRCPCCTVKEAKKTQQGEIPVRVQMSDKVGTDYYVDYKATINSFATEVIEEALPPVRCILLECVQFIPPILPEGFVPGSSVDDDDDVDRRKRRKVETNGNGLGYVASSAPTGAGYSPSPLSYASSVVAQRPTPTPAPAPASAPASAPAPAPALPRTTLDVSGQKPSSHPFAGPSYHPYPPVLRPPIGWTPTTATADGPSASTVLSGVTNGHGSVASPAAPGVVAGVGTGAGAGVNTMNSKPSFAGIVAGTAVRDRVDMARRETDPRMEVDPSVHVAPAA